jgi:N-methylhydantoinase B
MRFDGKRFSYIPQEGWRERALEHVELHTETVADIDLVTYQVIRHGLWNVNEEHGVTVQKVSGSPIAHYSQDLQAAMTLEDGEYVFGGPFIQLMSGTSDIYVRYILENLGANPGINEGDVFLADDPWIAGYQQHDHFVIHPVFWEGKIFCWVTGTLHHADCGGTLPGSFCVDAPDVFHEPLPMPPFKIMERGTLRKDLEDLFARRSRVPDLVRLDLRSQLAGVHVARERILRLVKRYGADVVKASMHRIVDESERSFVGRLRTIPDGKWSARNYIEAALPHDSHAYRLNLTLEKRGEFLIFSNDGTDPQFGAHNCTWAAWRSFIIPAINATLAFDQLFAAGGMLRHCVFKPNPGSIVNALHPGTIGTAIGALTVSSQSANVISRMLSASKTLRRRIISPSGLSGGMWVGMGGIDQWGAPYATISMDTMCGALGAGAEQDGTSASGMFWSPKSSIPNVEASEQSYPQLFLARRLNRGGGAGLHRGGDCVVLTWTPYTDGTIEVSPTGSGVIPPTSLGICGGLPARTGSFKLLRDTDVAAKHASGVLPTGLDELAGEVYFPFPKESAIPLKPGDVWEQDVMGAAGYGDPLDRDPLRVADDVATNQYSSDMARQVFCVVLDVDGPVDHAATEDLRQTARRERLAHATTKREDTRAVCAEDLERHPFLGALVWAETGHGPVIVCDRCDHILGDAAIEYKEHCSALETTLDKIGPGFGLRTDQLEDALVWREFYCPSCGVMVENELAKEGEPLLNDAFLDGFAAGS